MNRAELIDSIVEKTGQSKKDVDACLSATLESIGDAVASNNAVTIVGFGTFDLRTRGARTGRNPKTGETIQIGESKTVGFKAGKGLKAKVS